MENQDNFNANGQATTGLLKVIAWLIVIAVTLYSEIMFLGIISVIFPDGVLRVGAIIGAVATGASVLTLYGGKSKWFRPGNQLVAAWVFTAVEVAVMILNDMLAYATHTGAVDTYLLTWKQFTPASPVLALVGWGFIMFLDPARAIQHKRMEMQDKMQEAKLSFELTQFNANMQLQYKYLQHHTQHLARLVDAAGSQQALQQGAVNMTADVLSGLTGMPVSAGQIAPPGQTVESTIEPARQPVALAQTAPAPVPPTQKSSSGVRGFFQKLGSMVAQQVNTTQSEVPPATQTVTPVYSAPVAQTAEPTSTDRATGSTQPIQPGTVPVAPAAPKMTQVRPEASVTRPEPQRVANRRREREKRLRSGKSKPEPVTEKIPVIGDQQPNPS